MSREQRVDEIFSAALEIPPGRRDGFLAAQCGNDAQLRKEVEWLLAAAEEPDDALSSGIAELREEFVRSTFRNEGATEEDLSGERIGVWRLERRVARGGLGNVYLAHRDAGDYEQRAAFKVLRRGLDTDDVIARFRAERQILSNLKHPCIAGILDGGSLPDGRPFLVLDYVDGCAITEHCREQGLDVRARVSLMVTVLGALHYAHRHLVVHRDVKPSNILVTTEGHVSLLDFGIAKLLDPAFVTGSSTVTRTGVALLTPGYASPEQILGQPVTTASDIYQAGLVLFEILTDKRPATPTLDDDDQSPRRPSTELVGKPAFRAVRGDLDAIVLKATHPDPAARYASADEMMSDLQRHLEGLPVTAQGDSFGYRVRKLIRRRPWLAPAVLIAVLAVATYVVTLSLYSNRVRKEQRLAAASQQFLVDLLRSPDPFSPSDEQAGSGITVVAALDRGLGRVQTELVEQPALHAVVLAAISEVYGSLDRVEDAIRLRQQARDIQRLLYGERSRQVIESTRALGELYAAQGQMDEAGLLLMQQLEQARRVFPQGSADVGSAELATGVQAMREGDLERGRGLIEAGLDKLRPTRREHAREMIGALLSVAETYGMETQEEAYAAVGEAEEIARETFGEGSLQHATVQIRRASSMTIFGDYAQSERIFSSALPVMEQKLGKDHASTLSALNNLGYLYIRSGAFEKAEQIHRELLERQIDKHGPTHRAVADSYQNVGGAIAKQGRYEEAIPFHRKAYDTYRNSVNEDNFIIGFPLLSLAHAELMLGRAEVAHQVATEALERFKAGVPGTFLEGVAQCLVGLALEERGDVEQGAALIAESHALMRRGSIPEPYPALCRLPGRG